MIEDFILILIMISPILISLAFSLISFGTSDKTNKIISKARIKPKEQFKFAVYCNDLTLMKKCLVKFKKMGYLKQDVIPEQVIHMVYIPDKDIFVSHLCCEMWYPGNEENIMYGDEYLMKENI